MLPSPPCSPPYSPPYGVPHSQAYGDPCRGGVADVDTQEERRENRAFSAAPKNRGLLRKRGRHIAAQVVTQGASLTSVQARAMKAGRVTTPDSPWIARFSASTGNSQLRSNEAGARP